MTIAALDISQLSAIRAGALTPILGLLIDTALKGSILILAAAIAAHLLRNRSASARHAAWTAAVIGHLALPILTLLAPQWRLPIFPAPPWLDTPVTAVATASTIQPGLESSVAPIPSGTTPSAAGAPLADGPQGPPSRESSGAGQVSATGDIP
ncbi:MAG TPA: hypothetical protein VM939_01895, partial [Gemmatimonadaceae bacterium]|nr:hypothetical protein [Gemmatimonadaceae bacterium]